MRASIVLGLGALFCCVDLRAAEPKPKIAPPPSWVREVAVPSPDPNKSSAPLQFLLTSSQERVLDSGIDNYIEYVAIPQNAGGLQALGNITIPWNVQRADLAIHKIVVRRGDKTIDLLKDSELLVLRRENNLEHAVLDGVWTVVVPAKGLELGDQLDVAFTYFTKTSRLLRRPEEAITVNAKLPVALIERRFLVPDDVKVQWKVAGSISKPVVDKKDGVTEYRFVAKDVEAVEPPSFAPDRFKSPLIQLSGYSAWAEVADELLPGFVAARQVSKAELGAEADKIAAGHQNPDDRLLAALRLVQDKVRYVALQLGEGAYVPASADETWERRFGDCKGKTALLLSLLDRLGISAEPLLVSTSFDAVIGDQLPSWFLFDHVIVRATSGGKTYYLDATDYGQRTLSELAITPFVHGLPIRKDSSLETLSQGALVGPVREVALVWDASTDGQETYPYEATLTLRGAAAATMRTKLAGTTDEHSLDDEFKNMVPGLENDDLAIVGRSPEMPDGSFIVKFRGHAQMDWSPFEGRKERRFSFSNGTILWNANFDREKGPGKEWPVTLASRPYWERLTETVILPNDGKKYSLEASSLDEKLAGSTIKRMATLAGNRATVISEFRHFDREISAAEARGATSKLKDIGNDFAYVVGPPLPKKKQR
jgi:transglutaminase-like putative cysteine protease